MKKSEHQLQTTTERKQSAVSHVAMVVSGEIVGAATCLCRKIRLTLDNEFDDDQWKDGHLWIGLA